MVQQEAVMGGQAVRQQNPGKADVHLVGDILNADLAHAKQVTKPVPQLHQLLTCMHTALISLCAERVTLTAR